MPSTLAKQLAIRALSARPLLSQRRLEEAHEELMKALSARPHAIVMLGYRTVLPGHLGRTDEARVCLDKSLGKRGFKRAALY